MQDWAPPLRHLWEAQGKGLRDTSRTTDMDPGRLSRISTGKAQASVRELLVLAKALGLRDLAKLLEPWVRPR